MKIKFTKKLASGGYAPFTSTYMPVEVTNPYVDPIYLAVASLAANNTSALIGGASKTKSSSSSSGVSDSMKLLNNLHGLNNDVSYITSVLASSAQKDAIFGNSSDMVTDYYRNLQLVNQARESKEEFKNALSIAQTKNSLGDVATTMDGLIIVKNKKDGSLTAMAPELFYKNKDLFIPQTNGNLLYERSHNTKFALNDSILLTVLLCTSMQEIRKDISDLIGTLGQQENSLAQYVQKESGKFAQGIIALLNLGDKQQQAIANGTMPMDGVYKITFDSKSNELAAKYAISSIWGNLSDSLKALLKFRVGGSEANALQLITQMVMKGVNNTTTMDIDYQSDLNTDGSKKSGNGSGGGGQDPMSPQQQLLQGLAYSLDDIFNPGSAYQFNAKAYYSSLSMDNLGNGNTLQELNTKSSWNGMLDSDNYSMGGVPINKTGFSHVILGDSQIKAVDLPYRIDHGHIIPDMAKCKLMEKLDLQARNAGITDTEGNQLKMNAFYLRQGLPPKYIKSGDHWIINNRNYKRFAVLSGFADEGTLKHDSYEEPDKTLVINDDNENFYTETMKQKDKKFKLHGDVYSGSIFVPLRENVWSADILNGSTYAPHLPKVDANTKEAMQQEQNKLSTFKSAGNLSSYS